MVQQGFWPVQVVDLDVQPVQVGNEDAQLPLVDHQDVQLVQQDVRPVQVVDQDMQLPLLDREDEQPADQVYGVLAVSATQLPPDPPDQGLPRRSKRSVRRRFENLCEENLSNFPKQM
jgi:hypothetical protein